VQQEVADTLVEVGELGRLVENLRAVAVGADDAQRADRRVDLAGNVLLQDSDEKQCAD